MIVLFTLLSVFFLSIDTDGIRQQSELKLEIQQAENNALYSGDCSSFPDNIFLPPQSDSHINLAEDYSQNIRIVNPYNSNQYFKANLFYILKENSATPVVTPSHIQRSVDYYVFALREIII